MSCPSEGQDPVTNPHLCDHMENLWSGAQLCTTHLSVSGYCIPLGRRPISSQSVPAHRRGLLGVCKMRRDHTYTQFCGFFCAGGYEVEGKVKAVIEDSLCIPTLGLVKYHLERAEFRTDSS